MTMIAYVFLRHRRLAPSGGKNNQRTHTSTKLSAGAARHRRAHRSTAASTMPALIARLLAATSKGSAMAGFATRPSFAGHSDRSAKTNHELTSTPHHQMEAGHFYSNVEEMNFEFSERILV